MEDYLITRLGHHGDGIADGPVFAPLTLPGETITGRLEGERLLDVRIVTPSENRVKPLCRHFKSCGGCQLQHASESFVADWKVDVVKKALLAQGLKAEMRPIITSSANSRRRAVFSVKRTKKGAMAGFHIRSSDVIIEVPDCQLLHPSLVAVIPAIEAISVVGSSRKAELSVTATVSTVGVDLSVVGGKPLDRTLQSELGQECERWGLARLSWDGDVVAQRNPPSLRFGPADVVPPPGAFLQATEEGEAALLTTIQEIVGDAKSGIDLFAGCGTFTLPLATRARMHAAESEAAMLEALDAGWRKATGVRHVSRETRDLFRNPFMAEDLRYDFAVVDPPRAGAEAQCVELGKSDIPVIAFASCNPVSFARDAVILIKAGYTLEWIQVVDQFRWSSHVELVAKFTK